MQFADIDWDTWRAQDDATLIFVVRDGHILLMHKLRGMGAGKITGPGGKREPGEREDHCALRELREELGVLAHDPVAVGVLRFQFREGYRMRVTVFRADDYHGVPRSSEEAIPLWAPLEAIPYDRMWADDVHWLPLLLARTPFRGDFLFAGDRMLDHRLFSGPEVLLDQPVPDK